MQMRSDFLRYTWWTWNPDEPDAFSILYRGFNLFEAIAWATLAVLVWKRWYRHRKTTAEVFYGLAFLVFAWTDWAEAYASCVWLLIIKALTLILLVRLRKSVMSHYPTTRVF